MTWETFRPRLPCNKGFLRLVYIFFSLTFYSVFLSFVDCSCCWLDHDVMTWLAMRSEISLGTELANGSPIIGGGWHEENMSIAIIALELGELVWGGGGS